MYKMSKNFNIIRVGTTIPVKYHKTSEIAGTSRLKSDYAEEPGVLWQFNGDASPRIEDIRCEETGRLIR